MHQPAAAIGLQYWLKKMGYPRLIIAGFLLFLFIMAPITGSDLSTQITNVINRFSWNAVLVLAMVPMIHSGCGLNFGIPLGVLAGLLGGTLAIEMGFTGSMSFLMAIVVSTPFAILFGGGYGALLNKIKGGEMMVATYVGLSSVSFMCIMWLVIPYKHPSIVMAYTGVGLRNMFALDSFYAGVLADFLKIDLNPILGINLVIPTGSILFFALLTAVGSNPTFAKASGINVDRIRVLSVILSTWLGAVGVLVYQQGFGFVQLYTAPMNMTMPAVAAVLLGGASVNKASISNVVIGTILFQGLVTMTPTVITALIHTDVSEVIRIVVSNGMVVYALTRKTEGAK